MYKYLVRVSGALHTQNKLITRLQNFIAYQDFTEFKGHMIRLLTRNTFTSYHEVNVAIIYPAIQRAAVPNFNWSNVKVR